MHMDETQVEQQSSGGVVIWVVSGEHSRAAKIGKSIVDDPCARLSGKTHPPELR